MAALLLAALGVGLRYGFESTEATLWVLIIAVQSLPYLAAGLVSLSTALPERKAGERVALLPVLRGWLGELRAKLLPSTN